MKHGVQCNLYIFQLDQSVCSHTSCHNNCTFDHTYTEDEQISLPDCQVQRRTASERTVSTREVRWAAETRLKDRRGKLIQVLENTNTPQSRTTECLLDKLTLFLYILLFAISLQAYKQKNESSRRAPYG